jgi:hypothetical protein
VDDTVSGPHSPLTLSWLIVSARLIPGMFVLWLMLLGFVQKSCGGENRNLGMRYPLASRFKRPDEGDISVGYWRCRLICFRREYTGTLKRVFPMTFARGYCIYPSNWYLSLKNAHYTSFQLRTTSYNSSCIHCVNFCHIFSAKGLLISLKLSGEYA